MDGIAHGHARQIGEVDLVQKGMDQRFVGRANARRDTGLGELLLGASPRG